VTRPYHGRRRRPRQPRLPGREPVAAVGRERRRGRLVEPAPPTRPGHTAVAPSPASPGGTTDV